MHADMNEQRERIVDLISANSIVATASVREDYYLLQVLGNVAEALSKSTVDFFSVTVFFIYKEQFSTISINNAVAIMLLNLHHHSY